MKEHDKNSRRSFLRTAGAALVAASVPVTLAAQNVVEPGRETNNLKQMIVFGGMSEPQDSLPGTFGQASFQFQMRAEIGTAGGIASLTDPMLPEMNSRIKIHDGRRDINDIYVFRGTVERSLNPNLIGQPVTISIRVMQNDNCNVSLTIENTPIAALLLPAIQKVRDKNGY